MSGLWRRKGRRRKENEGEDRGLWYGSECMRLRVPLACQKTERGYDLLSSSVEILPVTCKRLAGA